MGIKCTCEGGIRRFTMYLKRIRKRNTVEQHKAVSLRSQIVTPDNNRILLKIKSLLLNLALIFKGKKSVRTKIPAPAPVRP
jgi:hypothetical protein